VLLNPQYLPIIVSFSIYWALPSQRHSNSNKTDIRHGIGSCHEARSFLLLSGDRKNASHSPSRLHGRQSFTTQKHWHFLFLIFFAHGSLKFISQYQFPPSLSTKAQTLLDTYKWKSYWFHIFTLILESYCLVCCWIWFFIWFHLQFSITLVKTKRGKSKLNYKNWNWNCFDGGE